MKAGATVYPKKYAHCFVVLCFVVVMQSFIMNSHEVFIHIHQGCFAGTGAIVRLPQCHWSKPDGYGKINQCITTTKHSKAKTVCIFLGIYCICIDNLTVIGSYNGLSPVWRQAIIWTNDGILLIGPSGTKFSEDLIKIHIFSLKKMHLKMSSGKWWPFCLGLNVLIFSLLTQDSHYDIMIKADSINVVANHVDWQIIATLPMCMIYWHDKMKSNVLTHCGINKMGNIFCIMLRNFRKCYYIS